MIHQLSVVCSVTMVTSSSIDIKPCSLSSESVAYETFCPVRVDEHLRQACALEESLIEQKERLKMRLKMISRTLKTL